MRIVRPIATLSAVLAIAVAVTAAGCGSSSDETTGASETTAPPPASTSTTPEQEAPVGVRAKSCSPGSTGGVRVTGVSCELGRSLVAGWYKNNACSVPQGASRMSCRLGKFICLGAVTESGVAVTCAAPGRSVAFLGREPS